MDAFSKNWVTVSETGLAALSMSDASSSSCESSKSSNLSTVSSSGDSEKTLRKTMMDIPRKKKSKRPTKEHWTDGNLDIFVETFHQKDKPQGCKEAQLRSKHGVYSCYRNCGMYFKSKKEEAAHYEVGLSCRNYIYNRKDLELTTKPTPPLEDVIRQTPISMDIAKIFKLYAAKGIDLPYTC